ncbi:hypothetical protein [Halopelagius fulvigenes]|uniref:Uncharacterized protein n=1 Tax=Halopelagius fulvigenes TaxID=1198324 RepID=A0ABD5U1T7_9EURY
MAETEPPTTAIRATYSEYLDGDATMAMISDPDAPNAWVLSSLTVPIEP